VTFPAGRAATGFGFDGVDDVVTVADDASLTPTAAFTLSAWFRLLSATAPSSAGGTGCQPRRLTSRS
jgi:hypothetical protein